MLNLKSIIIPAITVATSLLLLNGCGSDSASSAAALSIINHDGTSNITLSGSYESSCYDSGGTDTKEDVVVTGNSWAYTLKTYTDNTCTTETATSTITATLVAGTNTTSSGWVDGPGNPTTAPTEAVGGGTLDITPSFTPPALTMTVAGTGDFVGLSVGDTSNIFYVVDDSGGDTLYRDKDFSAGTDTRVGVDDSLANF